MKKQTRKLNLNRETLAPLQSEDLANVNGGELTVKKTTFLCNYTVLCAGAPTDSVVVCRTK
jgi:hypothetical protein